MNLPENKQAGQHLGRRGKTKAKDSAPRSQSGILRTSQAIRKLAGARRIAADAKENTLARTVKFRINLDGDPALKKALFRHITVCESFREHVLNDLRHRWEENPQDFEHSIKGGKGSPYQSKKGKPQRAFGIFYTRYVKGGTSAFPGLTTDMAKTVVNSLGGMLKSFLKRRENVIRDEITKRAEKNIDEWQTILRDTVPDLRDAADRENLPEPPPPLAEPVTEQTITQHNAWVARARVWVNLMLRQKYKLEKDAAPMPQRLKGFPSFPGKMRYARRDATAWRAKLFELLDHARERAATIGDAFASVTTGESGEWQRIKERYENREGGRTDGKTVFAGLVKRVAALVLLHPEWTPRQHAEELARGLLQTAAKLEEHLKHRHTDDRQAARKLSIICNALCSLALEPLRVRADWARFAATDEQRRQLYGDWRGLLAQPSDESAAVEITGFGVKTGTMQYGGVLAFRQRGTAEQEHDWAFVYSGVGGGFSLLTTQTSRRGSSRTEWRGIATTGGAKSAADTAKQAVLGTVWMTDKANAAVLPLQFGKMQGRHYLWNSEGDITKGKGWVPMSAKLLCEWPPRSDWNQATFYLALSLSKEVKIATDRLQPCIIIGIDRGEMIPACYGIVDAKGRRLESGQLADDYRAAVEKLQQRKQDLQRSKGGYTRALRKDERNMAQSMCGAVTQQILDLSARHDAPVVLEELTPGIPTRGGKGTFMSAMQYSRIQTALEQKFAEAGRYALPSKKQKAKDGNGCLRFVKPHNTSQTCSVCGAVHDAEFYEALPPTLRREADGTWSVQRSDDTRLAVPAAYEYTARRGERKARQVHESLDKAFGGSAEFAALSKTAKKDVSGWIKRALDHRPDQAQFICRACGHEDHADEQAAVNIARKHLLALELGKGPTKQQWKEWVARRCREGWA